MKIALYQMHIIWEDKTANYLQLKSKLRELKDKGIELLLLPEMSFTGFSMNTDVTKESHMDTVSRMKEYAKQYRVAIGFGWVKDCGEKCENHYTIVNEIGEILSDYAKIHPFSFSGEDKKFRGGGKIEGFEFDGIPFSSFICYDLRFPEIFQIASKEAHIILVPANWPQKRRGHWRCLLQARAIENQVYIIAVNCVGEIGGVAYSGDSCVINPNGEMLLELSEKEGILEYELTDDVESFRKDFNIKNDRNEKMYYGFMNDVNRC
ncbi:MAG TPA: carbon-nitrogen family hydrolase [Lachnospiraceae bacterium]|nr:carbon-nitrogen family hydrolase [Lachnospiraceae bacterium]